MNNNEVKLFDNKFGIIDDTCAFKNPNNGLCGYNLPDTEKECDHKGCERSCVGYFPNRVEPKKMEKEDVQVKLEGVGKDAEVISNSNGGLQSKSPLAMHLVDAGFLLSIARKLDNIYAWKAIKEIATFMVNGDKNYLQSAVRALAPSMTEAVEKIGKVLKEGATKYKPNNWRLIPQEDHINHALTHILAAFMGDTQDNHIDHALCRLMMAYATEPSEGFKYGEYVK